MRALFLWLLTLPLLLGGVASHAIDASAVPENKRTTLNLYLTPIEAWEMIQAQPDRILFLDVRTRAEAIYVGMPDAADGLVPFVDHEPFWSWDDKRKNYRLEPVQNFVPEATRRLTEKGLDKNDIVMVMCRSGTRSAMAANRLAEAGFTRVYNLVEGFEGDARKQGPVKGQRTLNGWKNTGLPWSYPTDRSRLYFEP